MFFDEVRNLFKRFQGLCRSVIVQVGSNAGRIFDLSDLRKKTQKVVKYCAEETNYKLFQCSQELIQMIRGSM